VVENDSYKILATIPAADINNAIENEKNQIDHIKTNVADGAPDGFGIALLKTGSTNLCVAVPIKWIAIADCYSAPRRGSA
jgi:hypothetical protein